MSRFSILLADALQETVPLSAAQVSALQEHCELLQRWNRRMNLTSVRKLDEIVLRHYAESVFLAAQLPPGALRIADIGSGPGFPGLPVAVMRPECRLTLVESNSRKCVFLRESTRAFTNVTVAECRAASLRESFDWVVSRAVAWREVLPVTHRIAESTAFLLGEADAKGLSERGEFVWKYPIPIPWGDRRVILIGERST